MTQVQRYSNLIRGKFIFTGNTIGFSSQSSFGLGAFLSVTPGLSAYGFPTPSTTDWTKNGSTAILSIPASHYVEYAELVWIGSTIGVASPAIDVNTSITFITPLGSNTIFPDTITSQSGTGFDQLFYTRSQDVTTLVRSAGSGTYTVTGIPSTLEPSPGATSCGGWSLAIVASHPSLPYQSLTFYVSSIISSASPVNTTFSGFTTPLAGSFASRVLITSCEGNSSILGDYCKLGPDAGTLTSLFGPNNSATNFFQSQINNGNSFSPSVGQLDTTGSFGNLNQPAGSQFVAVRSGFDLTNVPGPPLPNSISSAVLSIGTSGDAYAVSSFALQFDVNNAQLEITKFVDKSTAPLGDQILYTIAIKNTGNYVATNILFSDTIPSDTSFVSGSFSVNGIPYPTVNSNSFPITLPDILANNISTITFNVIATTLPTNSKITNSSSLTYTPLLGSSTVESALSNIVSTTIISLNLTTQKSVNTAFAALGLTLTYTVTIANLSTSDITNITFIDSIPDSTSFIPSSVNINNVNFPSLNPNSPGIFLGTLPSNTLSTITFSVTVSTIPNDGKISNSASLRYSYPENTGPLLVKDTNTVTSTLLLANLTTFQKSVNRVFTTCDDILTYTLSFVNNGNTPAINVFFSDTLASSLTFVNNSVKFNDLPQPTLSPISGFSLPDILPDTTFTLSFSALVNCPN